MGQALSTVAGGCEVCSALCDPRGGGEVTLFKCRII